MKRKLLFLSGGILFTSLLVFNFSIKLTERESLSSLAQLINTASAEGEIWELSWWQQDTPCEVINQGPEEYCYPCGGDGMDANGGTCTICLGEGHTHPNPHTDYGVITVCETIDYDPNAPPYCSPHPCDAYVEP